MKVTIAEKNENKLLHRIMVQGQLEFEEATPSNAQLAEALAKEMKKELNLVVVKKIHTQFGQRKARFSALVYDQQADKDRLEKMTKHLKKKAEGAAPADNVAEKAKKGKEA